MDFISHIAISQKVWKLREKAHAKHGDNSIER